MSNTIKIAIPAKEEVNQINFKIVSDIVEAAGAIAAIIATELGIFFRANDT